MATQSVTDDMTVLSASMPTHDRQHSMMKLRLSRIESEERAKPRMHPRMEATTIVTPMGLCPKISPIFFTPFPSMSLCSVEGKRQDAAGGYAACAGGGRACASTQTTNE
jgi:hypothetical protein